MIYFLILKHLKYFIKRFDSIRQEFVKQAFTRFFGYLLALMCLGSCVGTRHLEDGEKLLYKQSITGATKAEKNKLYDEIKPLNHKLALGLCGVNRDRSGDHFYFALTR